MRTFRAKTEQVAKTQPPTSTACVQTSTLVPIVQVGTFKHAVATTGVRVCVCAYARVRVCVRVRACVRVCVRACLRA